MKFIASYNLFLCFEFQLDREILSTRKAISVRSPVQTGRSSQTARITSNFIYFFIALLNPLSKRSNQGGSVSIEMPIRGREEKG